MARPDKAASVAEITEAFQGSSAAVITEYRGLRVAEMKELRRALGGDVQYAVVKNTLTKIAAKQAGLELDSLLEGPTAIAFIKGDPVEAAKGLRDFAKAHPLLVIKGGVLDDKALTPEEIRKLADLESRETLLAKLAGAMNASLQQAVSLFAAPLSQAARLAAALRDKVEQEGPAGGTSAAASDDSAAGTEASDSTTDASDSTTDTSDTADAAPAAEATDAADAAPAAEATDGTDTAVEAPNADADTTPDATATDATDETPAAEAAAPAAGDADATA
jgi:large subunit ribosomal protein L10